MKAAAKSASAPTAASRAADVGSVDDEDEDLLSSTGGSSDKPDDAPAPVAVPADMELEDEEEPVLKPPGFPEPVKQSIDEAALDAKVELKKAVKTATPVKAVS